MKPLLTICIPAYGRPETLARAVEEFAKQNCDEIELIIADDESPDGTAIELAVKPYIEANKNFRFSRNAKNLGYSANVVNLYEMATTRYVWFFCDDDLPLEGSVSRVLATLKAKEPTVAIYNHKQYDPYGNYIEVGAKKDIFYDKVSDIQNYQELQRCTFLSVLALEKPEGFDLSQLKSQNFRNNVFVQLTLALMLLSDNCRFAQFAAPVLHRNVGYNYGDFFKFYIIDHLRAVNIVKTAFEPNKFLYWSINDLPVALNLYLSQKLGLYSYRKRPTLETVKDIFRFWGIFGILPLMIPVISFFVPKFVLEYVFFTKLWLDHGYSKARELYIANVNRAFRDTRKTGFINYR